MRVTPDTNIIISALFWRGNPRRILDAARDGLIEFFTTEALISELEDVLHRERFVRYLADADVAVKDLVQGYSALASVVAPASIEAVVLRDPDDDAVLACAVASESEIVVSGDDDLLSLATYRDIRILTATDLLILLDL